MAIYFINSFDYLDFLPVAGITRLVREHSCIVPSVNCSVFQDLF